MAFEKPSVLFSKRNHLDIDGAAANRCPNSRETLHAGEGRIDLREFSTGQQVCGKKKKKKRSIFRGRIGVTAAAGATDGGGTVVIVLLRELRVIPFSTKRTISFQEPNTAAVRRG